MLGCAELRMRVLSSEHTPHAPYCTVFGKLGKALADGLNRLCLCAEVCNFGIIVLIASSVPELVGRAIRATVEGLGWNPRWRFIAAIAARAVPTILVSGESRWSLAISVKPFFIDLTKSVNWVNLSNFLTWLRAAH